jgi:hypothetical protein
MKISQLNRYADPDADHREDFDGPPVQQRAAARRFKSRFMGSAASLSTGVNGLGIETQEISIAPGVVVPDLTPTETDIGPLGHVALRNGLIQNFSVLWAKREVQWLKYPKLK